MPKSPDELSRPLMGIPGASLVDGGQTYAPMAVEADVVVDLERPEVVLHTARPGGGMSYPSPTGAGTWP